MKDMTKKEHELWMDQVKKAKEIYRDIVRLDEDLRLIREAGGGKKREWLEGFIDDVQKGRSAWGHVINPYM